MEATGQGSKIDGPRELELLVVTTAEQGGVDDVVLDFGQGAMGREEVALTVIAEAGETAQVGEEAMGELPDVDEGRDAAQDQNGGAGEVIVEHFMKGPGVAGAAFVEGIHVDSFVFFGLFIRIEFCVYSGETSSAGLTP